MTNRMDTEALRALKDELRGLYQMDGACLQAADAIEQLEADRDRWKAMAGELSKYHADKLAEAKAEASRYRAEGDSESAATCLHEAILHSEALNVIRSLSPEEIMKKEGL